VFAISQTYSGAQSKRCFLLRQAHAFTDGERLCIHLPINHFFIWSMRPFFLEAKN